MDVRGRELLTQMARELCQNTGVDLSHGGRYEHVELFQNYLPEYTIVVVLAPRDILPVASGRPRLNLIMENFHYNVIFSLTGAFSVSYFCECCSQRYSDKRRHKNCPYICPCCHDNPPCRIDNQSVACNARQRTFRGQVCFNKRKTSKLCDKLKRCDRCMTYFWLQKNKQHVCGVSYCPTCRADKPVRHLCYMVPNNLESTKKLDRSKFLLCFYDLETRQENQISANMFRHESNLCISQQVCQACITNQEEICERCGVRENVFYGTDSVERFLSHLVRLSINFNVTVIAHNEGRFNGCFILQETCKDFSRWTPEIVRNGTKLMLIRCGSSLRFIDRLNFIQLPLSQFPEAFNIAGCNSYLH
jgi:hypothetical protein